ncbi:diaminopropionate ammonia-lyase [candidate division GN15 bacterium]|nr:diaminopropionate ammonia-lyase [candidate division GN15 bacterium]
MSRAIVNPFRKPNPVTWDESIVSAFRAKDIRDLHRSLPAYAPTPLVKTTSSARISGSARLLIKDESHRFGLKAFKALGASYAVYKWFAQRQAVPSAERFYQEFKPSEKVTFCTATDGNHGRGVAWVAEKLGLRAVIFMPKGTVKARVENIRIHGADVHVVDGDYDAAVALCAEQAERNGWQIISDTSWPGYQQIPRWIQAGYVTMFEEIHEQCEGEIDIAFIPGGVGALAATAAWWYSQEAFSHVKLVSVEPISAACLLESIENRGEPRKASGELNSMMAGLNCGMPSQVAWPLIQDRFDLFMTIDDEAAEAAMRYYHRGLGGAPSIESGESGAATLGALLTLSEKEGMAEARRSVALDANSTVLLLNTEGATDPDGWERVVGEG